MARCRNLKPGFFANEVLAELPPLCRLLFAGLWCFADRDGRLEDRPKRIKAQILPFDECDVDDYLTQLSRGDDPFVVRYLVDGNRFLQIVKWHDNQVPHHTEKPSVIPAPPLDSWSPPVVRQPPIIGSEVQGSEVQRKGDARGKPKVGVSDVPITDSLNTPEVRQAIEAWLTHKHGRHEGYKDGAYLGRLIAKFPSPAALVAAVEFSIGNNYAGIFPAKDNNGKPPRKSYRFQG